METKKDQKMRTQNIMTFLKVIKTNICKKFFTLINRHFPKHKMPKIFNKNSIKLSYSCCRSMGSVTASHNRRIIRVISNNNGYNCKKKNRMST